MLVKLVWIVVHLSNFCLCKEIIINEAINDIDQEDPRLVQYIKEHLLEPPPKNPEKLNETVPRHYKGLESYSALVGQYGQPLFLEGLFDRLIDQEEKDRKKFFIEAGAFDGVTGSNTLRFELSEDWTGLLVEPHPLSYDAARSLQRNAWTIQTCFSVSKSPSEIQFDSYEAGGSVVNPDLDERPSEILGFPGGVPNSEILKMQCMPFYSIIAALENPKIDFFSLDIDGVDLQVLETIPWHLVDISVLEIETAALGDVFPGDWDVLATYLNDKGYVFYKRLSIDDIFVHKSLIHKLL